ncbi:MAG TPA: hypothetical protein PKN28_07530, partial [Clostridiales bacterium]|nr:hypothetical protein [Clostridiales bacterium]
MTIRFYSYVFNKDISYSTAKNIIQGAITPGETSDFEDYCDLTELFTALEESLNSTDVHVLTAAPVIYNDLKSAVIEVLGLQAENNLAIKLALGDTLLSQDAINSHCLVPADSSVLFSIDGMYCGFYMESQGQYIVLLPLDKDRLGYMLDSSDLPFANKDTAQINLTPAESEKIHIPDEHINEAFLLIRQLRENSQRVALPLTGATEYLKAILENCDGWNEYFKLVPHIEDKSVQKPGEYAAQTAKIARELAGTNLGVFISDIYENFDENENNQAFSFICVADEHKAIVRKLYANPGETRPDLLEEAAFGLLLLIKKIASDLAAIKEALYSDKNSSDNAEESDEEENDGKPEENNGRPVGNISKK